MNTDKDFSNTMPWTNTQVRNNPFPLERYSIFDSIDSAKDYVNGVDQYAGKAYEGQIIAVSNNGIQEAYILDSAAKDGLRKLSLEQSDYNSPDTLVLYYNENSQKITTHSFEWNDELTQSNIDNAKQYGNENDLGYVVGIKIGNKLTHISDNALSGCNNLSTISIVDTIVNIGANAFDGCNSLTALLIPSSVTYIGENALSNCAGLSTEGCVVFEGKHLSDISVMENHYWGLELSNIAVYKNEVSKEWVDSRLQSLSNYIYNDISVLSDQISIIVSTDLPYLSDAISCKIYTGTSTNGNYTDLSVIKIPKDEYEQKVVEAERSCIYLSDNVLYIVSADYIDTYGQVISNLVMTDDLTESEAATQHYVDSQNDAISTSLDSSISCKVYVGNFIDSNTVSGNYTDISVMNISKEIYEQKIIDAILNNTAMFQDNILYIVSANNIDAYGRRMSNLTMSNDHVPSEATNKHYVDKIADETLRNKQSINDILSAFNSSKFTNNPSLNNGISLTSNIGTIVSALVTVWKYFGG